MNDPSDVLHLVLSFRWFDEIERGTKPVEYRKMNPFWKKRIWIRRHSISAVIFHRGYTPKKAARAVSKIDVGPCPYAGWSGNYYRIFIRAQNPKVEHRPTGQGGSDEASK